MNPKSLTEVMESTDPVCTWCWGSEPVPRKPEMVYEDKIKVGYIMVGLAEDVKTFRDVRNDIEGDLSKDNQNIAGHWLEASERHDMPVEVKGSF